MQHARRGARARRGDARARDARRPRGRRAADGHGPAARAAPSATRSRFARRSPRTGARGRPTSPSSSSPHRRDSLALSDLGHRRGGRAGARRGRRSPTARPRRPTGAGSRRRAAIPTRIGSRRRRSCARSRPTRTAGSRSSARCRVGHRRARSSGAGRRSKDDEIDHAVGIVCLKKRGDRVAKGEPLAEIHARDEASARGSRRRACGPLTSWASRRPSRQGVVLRRDRLASVRARAARGRDASARGLEPALVGRRLERVEILDARLVRPFEPLGGRRRARGRGRRRGSIAAASI